MKKLLGLIAVAAAVAAAVAYVFNKLPLPTTSVVTEEFEIGDE